MLSADGAKYMYTEPVNAFRSGASSGSTTVEMSVAGAPPAVFPASTEVY